MKTTKEFELYRNRIVNEIITLFSFISIYKLLRDARNERLEEINFAPAFFGTISASLYTSIIILINKLFDKNGERSIYDFLNFVEKNIELFSKSNYINRKLIVKKDDWRLKNWTDLSIIELRIFKNEIDNNNSLLNVKTQRDKYYAHFDKKYFSSVDNLYNDAPIKWNDFFTFQEILEKIINRISVVYDGSSIVFDVVNINDLKGILDIVEKHISKLDSELKELNITQKEFKN